MASIRKTRKAFKRKYGLKKVSIIVKGKSGKRIRISPTVCKQFREQHTKLMNKSLFKSICTLTVIAEG